MIDRGVWLALAVIAGCLALILIGFATATPVPAYPLWLALGYLMAR